MSQLLPTDSIVKHFNLRHSGNGDWLDSLLVSVHPDRTRVAVAHRTQLAIFPLLSSSASDTGPDAPGVAQPQQHLWRQSYGSSYSPHSSTSQDDITDILWVTFLRSAGRTSYSRGGGSSGGASTVSSARRMLEEDEAAHDAALGMVGRYSEVCLLAGTSKGCLQLHDELAAPLVRQRVHATAVRRIRHRVRRMGLKQDEYQEDITLTFANGVARITAWDLRVLLQGCAATRAALAAAGEGTASAVHSSLAAPHLSALPLQVWDLPRGVKARTDALALGYRPRSLYSLLQGVGSSKAGGQKLVVVTAGESPSLVALEVYERHHRGALAALAGMATSITSNVVGLASIARHQVAQGPRAMLVQGLRTFVFSALLSPQPPPEDQPLVAFDDLKTAAPQAEPAPTWRTFRDDGRNVLALCAAPRGSLLVSTDSAGRALLIDGSTLVVIRMWKGFRDAQCGWLEIPLKQLRTMQSTSSVSGQATSSHNDAQASLDANERRDALSHTLRLNMRATSSGGGVPGASTDGTLTNDAFHTSDSTGQGAPFPSAGATLLAASALVLALYAPRRQTIELWLAPHGPRLASLRVGLHCKLLQVPAEFASWGAAVVEDGDQGRESGTGGWHTAGYTWEGRRGLANCLLLDAAEGTLLDVASLLLSSAGVAVHT